MTEVKLNPRDFSLTDKQFEVLKECLEKLDKNGIGLGHDYQHMGTLFAYNKVRQKHHGYETRTYGIGKDWEKYEINDGDTVDRILDKVTYLVAADPKIDREYLFLGDGVTYVYPLEYIKENEK